MTFFLLLMGLICSPSFAASTTQVAGTYQPYQAPGWTGFTPNSLFVAYWRASDLSDGAVATWTDVVGGLAPTQATGSLQPVRSSVACNGTPGVTFDGVDDNLSVSATTGLPSGTSEGWIFVVVNQRRSDGSTAFPFAYGVSTNPNARSVGRIGTASRAVVSLGSTALTDTGGFIDGIHVLTGHFTSSLVEMWIDGRPASIPSASASPNTSTTRTRIGAGVSGSAANFWTGSVCSIGVASGALTATQRQQIEAYFAWSVAAPFVLSPFSPYRFVRP